MRQTVPENSLSLAGTAIIMQERLASKEDVFLVLSWEERQRMFFSRRLDTVD